MTSLRTAKRLRHGETTGNRLFRRRKWAVIGKASEQDESAQCALSKVGELAELVVG